MDGVAPRRARPDRGQLGSGSWDLEPGITVLGMSERTSWGLQGKGSFRLNRNSRGYKRGSVIEGTGWFAVSPTSRLSLGAGSVPQDGPLLETDRVLTVGWQKSFDPIGHH